MPDPYPLVELVLARLERISADSPLAHRASGVRGALLRVLDEHRHGTSIETPELEMHVSAALRILEQAACRLPGMQATAG
jgi:hypothetical protein